MVTANGAQQITKRTTIRRDVFAMLASSGVTQNPAVFCGLSALLQSRSVVSGLSLFCISSDVVVPWRGGGGVSTGTPSYMGD